MVPIQFVVSFYKSFPGWSQDSVWRIFCSTREDVVQVCLQIGSVATYRIVSFHGEGFSVSCHHMHFVWLQVGRSTPTHRGLCFFNAQYMVCLQLSLNFVCLCLSLRLVVRAGQANRALIIDVHAFLHWAPDSHRQLDRRHQGHNYVTTTSRIRPRLVRKRFTTKQIAHRNRVTYRKSASIGSVEHKTPHSHLHTCERFVSRVLSCNPCERVAKVVLCLCQSGAIRPVDISHLQLCFLFAMVHSASRNRSMGDLQTW